MGRRTVRRIFGFLAIFGAHGHLHARSSSMVTQGGGIFAQERSPRSRIGHRSSPPRARWPRVAYWSSSGTIMSSCRICPSRDLAVSGGQIRVPHLPLHQLGSGEQWANVSHIYSSPRCGRGWTRKSVVVCLGGPICDFTPKKVLKNSIILWKIGMINHSF